MAFPNFSGKHDQTAVFSPEQAVAAFTAGAGPRLPQGVIITYQRQLVEHLRATGGELRTGFPAPWREMWRVTREGSSAVGVINGFGIGAPAAAMVVEELIAMGVTRIINMGTAGCLQTGLDFGELVLCDAAVRDEGVSHHYLPAGRFSYPSTALSAEIADELSARGLKFTSGPTWSTDAIFRETVAEARAYQREGVVTVEMEAAALFAVGEYRKVEVAAAFMVSDHVLPDTPWASAFHSDAVQKSSVALLEASIAVLGRTDDGALPEDPGPWKSEGSDARSSFDC